VEIRVPAEQGESFHQALIHCRKDCHDSAEVISMPDRVVQQSQQRLLTF